MPEKHNKRSEMILPKSNDYLVVAISYQQPLLLEKVEQTKPPKSSSLSIKARSQVNARSKLYAPSFGVAETIGNCYISVLFHLHNQG